MYLSSQKIIITKIEAAKFIINIIFILAIIINIKIAKPKASFLVV